MSSLELLDQDSAAFMRASVVAAMAELDLSTAILKHGNSASLEELAKACACDPRGLEALLDALSALGYLSKDGSASQARYAVAQDYTELLDSRKADSYMPMLRHRASMLRSWAHLVWAVQDGRPKKSMAKSFLGPETDSISFISAMNAIALRLTDQTMAELQKSGVLAALPADARILDIGGASGTYTLAFLKQLPKASACIFDLPAGISQAKKRFLGSEYADRVRLVEGDFTRTDLPQSYDFAWLSAIIHQLGRQESQALYAKIYAALKPCGLLAIRDFVMDESRTSPADGTLFALNMLVATEHGRVYTFAEISEDLSASGFIEIKKVVDVPTMSSVVLARKP